MVITYTQNPNSSTFYGRGRYSRSYNGGAAGTWYHGNIGSSYTTRFTWVSCDTNGTDGYCTFIWGDIDSLNVRRSTMLSREVHSTMTVPALILLEQLFPFVLYIITAAGIIDAVYLHIGEMDLRIYMLMLRIYL